MKEVKSMLVLNKRTVACLNNLEMQHVRGGDGEVGWSLGICDQKDTANKLTDFIKSITIYQQLTIVTSLNTKIAC
jgi:hypothetical protein